MEIRRTNRASGFTLVEFMVAVLISMIAIFAIGVVLIDSPRSFKHSYGRAQCDIVTQGYAARRLFDATVRKSIGASLKVPEDGKWLEVSHFGDEGSTFADRYSLLYVSNGQLNVQRGQLDAKGVKKSQDTWAVCDNVTACTFKQRGRSVRMVLSLEDERSSQTVVCSAVMHN